MIPFLCRRTCLLLVASAWLAQAQNVGEVQLYKDKEYDNKWTIKIDDYLPRVINRIPKSDFRDSISSIRWNLPRGYAITFLDEFVSIDELDEFFDHHIVRGYTCVGSDKDGDIHNNGIGDKIEYFVVYKYSLNIGYIYLQDESGVSALIFPEFYPEGAVVDISDWYLDNRVDKLDYSSLGDMVYMELYDTSTGGRVKASAKGFLKKEGEKSVTILSSDNKNRISSFMWQRINPVEVEIESVESVVSIADVQGKTYTSRISGRNEFPIAQGVTVTVSKSQGHSLVTTVVKQFESASSIMVEARPGNKIIGFKFTYEHSKAYSKARTQEVFTNIEASLDATIPKNSDFDISYIVKVGKMPDISFNVGGKFWYDTQVSGSSFDNSNNLYLRTETLQVFVKGDAGIATLADFGNGALVL